LIQYIEVIRSRLYGVQYDKQGLGILEITFVIPEVMLESHTNIPNTNLVHAVDVLIDLPSLCSELAVLSFAHEPERKPQPLTILCIWLVIAFSYCSLTTHLPSTSFIFFSTPCRNSLDAHIHRQVAEKTTMDDYFNFYREKPTPIEVILTLLETWAEGSDEVRNRRDAVEAMVRSRVSSRREAQSVMLRAADELLHYMLKAKMHPKEVGHEAFFLVVWAYVHERVGKSL
jgi:hypothetical protein